MEVDTLNDSYYVIMWLRDVGILEKVTCHDEEMKVIQNTQKVDGWVLRCDRCRQQYSVRKKSIFFQFKISILHIYRIVFRYFMDNQTIAVTAEQTQNNKKTISRIYQLLHNQISFYMPMWRDDIIFNSDCEVDEIKYASIDNKEVKCFGIYNFTSKKCLLFVLEDTLNTTLLPIIQRHISNNCTVYSQKFLPLPNYHKLKGKSFFSQYWAELKKESGLSTGIKFKKIQDIEQKLLVGAWFIETKNEDRRKSLLEALEECRQLNPLFEVLEREDD